MTPQASAFRNPPHDPAAVARAILSDSSRYHLALSHVRVRPKSWLQNGFEWVRDRYDALVHALAAHVHVSRTESFALGGLVIAVLAVVMGVAAFRLLRELNPETVRPARTNAIESGPDARALYARSLRAAQAGQFARATTLLFAAAVAGLDLRGTLRGDPSATVGEFRRALRARDATLLPKFDAIARPFTAAAYAERSIDEAEWTSARAAFAQLVAEVPGDAE